MTTKEANIKILQMIAKDMENDAEELDGKPFNGKVVAGAFGKQGAAIAALANIMEATLKEKTDEKK